MKKRVRLLLLALVMASTIGCDRVTKQLATEFLADQPTQSYFGDSVRLVYAENTGGFLSLGTHFSPQTRGFIFIWATGALLLVLSLFLVQSRGPLWRSLALALFLAGGISNWIDRALRGSVVDFINVGVGWLRTGIFNVADVAIMLAIGIVVLVELAARARVER